MGIVAKNQDPDPGAAPPERRHNLPLKASPVVGRRQEMQRVVSIFDRIRVEGRPRRVEVVGPQGIGASTVAIELARRAGHRFPGGAWYVDLSMGTDVAWAVLGAVREQKPVTDLAAAATAARERLGDEPKGLVVIDGATSAEEALAALPPSGPNTADVFVVAEKPLGTVDADQVCEVSAVPSHAARRMAHAMLQHGQPDVSPPPVRSMDGLALTASLAARAALAFQGKEGPLTFEDTNAAMQRVIRLVARNAIALELLLLLSVAHPARVPVDALFGGLAFVRRGRGPEPNPDETGQGVMWLVHAGVVEPLDEQHFSIHPMLQHLVHGMTRTPADLELAREALVEGLVLEANSSLTEAGVDLPRASLHQLRFLAKTAPEAARAKAADAAARVERAVGGLG
jgi:hypothetical protein